MQSIRIRMPPNVAIAFLSSVLQPLVDGGYLTARDVMLIEQTCQDLHEACQQDSLWAALCQREYPITKLLPKIKREQGYRLLYKSWSSPISNRRPPNQTLGPPSCLPSQVYICIHIKYDGSPVRELTFSGKRFKSLLEDGCIQITFNKDGRIILGKAKWNYGDKGTWWYNHNQSNGHGLPVGCKTFDPSKLSVQIHLYRSSDLGMCCLYDSNDNNVFVAMSALHLLVHPQDADNSSSEPKFDLSKRQRPGNILFRYRKINDVPAWPLQHTRQSKLILEAFPNPVFFRPRFEVAVAGEDDYCITKMILKAETTTESSPIGTRRFRNNEDHGVTLLHIFSELQAT